MMMSEWFHSVNTPFQTTVKTEYYFIHKTAPKLKQAQNLFQGEWYLSSTSESDNIVWSKDTIKLSKQPKSSQIKVDTNSYGDTTYIINKNLKIVFDTKNEIATERMDSESVSQNVPKRPSTYPVFSSFIYLKQIPNDLKFSILFLGSSIIEFTGINSDLNQLQYKYHKSGEDLVLIKLP